MNASNRTFSILSALLAGCLVGCQQPRGGDGAMDSSVVDIGSTKVSFLGPPAEFRALHRGLENCFGCMVRFSAQPDGAAIGEQLKQGRYQYAIMSAGEYVAIPDASQLTLLATAVNPLGRSSRKAYVVIKANSHLKSIQDCAGKRFAFGTYTDLLTDLAARKVLEKAGVPVKKLLLELVTPPPLAFEGRLYLKQDVAKIIASDPTVNAGVIDEVTFEQMPETGGNIITGPSKDQFERVGETIAVPELVVVAGPSADPARTERLKGFLLNEVTADENICKQLGVTGFTEADAAAFTLVRGLLQDDPPAETSGI